MAKQKAKVKAFFTHQGKQYKPGEEFEGEAHEIANLQQQGHLEGGTTQPSAQHPGGQQGQSQGQGAQAPHPSGSDPGKQPK